MKNLLILTILVCSIQIAAQTSTGRSKPGSLVTPKLDQEIIDNESELETGLKYHTPFLKVDLQYSEPSGNNYLDADEEGAISIDITNIGKMTTEECEIQLKSEYYDPNLTISGQKKIDKILSGETKKIDLKIAANKKIKTGEVKFTLKILEKNGFDLDPEKVLIIPTREFQPPINEIVDYGIDDQNRNLKIEKFETVDFTFRIQNRGENISYNTIANIVLGDNIVRLDEKDVYKLGDLKPGEFGDITVKIATNARATEVRIAVNVSEQTGLYPVSKTYNLPFDVIQKRPEEIIIAKGKDNILNIPDVSNLGLDIAENIPHASEKKRDAVAVIIGNKDYSYVPDVDFAINDAAIMRNYVKDAFGYNEENIIYIENATQSDFMRVFGTGTNYKGKLFDYLRTGLSEVFIYYSGHGAPDTDQKQGYIVPVDCDPNKVSLNGYSIKTLYDNLDKAASEKDLKHVTVVLDACFSGNSVKGSLLKNISPLGIIIEYPTLAFENSSVITSTSVNQVSTWYLDKKQGLFTYFFLKGVQGNADINHDKIITVKEVYEYTVDEVNGVPYWARRLNHKSQTPTFFGVDYVLVR